MKKEQKAPFSVRHGDVLLVDAAYRGKSEQGELVKSDKGRVILAYGEVGIYPLTASK